MKLLWIAVIALLIVFIARVVRIFEISAELKGGRQDDVVSDNENRNQASLFVLFIAALFAFFWWTYKEYSPYLLPESSSAHGPAIDQLFAITMAIIIVVFIITHVVLGYQLYKNYARKGRKAFFFAHSTKLELVWTIVPAIVLSTLIVYGLKVWNDVIYPKANNPIIVELYAKQYNWTARYAGEDNKLGGYNYRLIDGNNELGLDNDENVGDDILVKGEFHLPVNRPVLFKFRSQDVIHSAYMPHFRAQMNCVPGMETQFEFTPTKTTQDIRKLTNNPNYNYVLLCNKICGGSHFNMQMDIVVESEEDFNKWLSKQQTWAQRNIPAEQPSTAENLDNLKTSSNL